MKDLSLYHSYPIENKDDVLRSYQANDYFKGYFSQGDHGYYRFELTAGKYAIIINEDANHYEYYFYDQNMVKIETNVDKSYTADTDGIYYMEVVARDPHGYFDLKLVKVK